MIVPYFKVSLLDNVNEQYFDNILNLTYSIATFNFNLSFYELDADSDLKES